MPNLPRSSLITAASLALALVRPPSACHAEEVPLVVAATCMHSVDDRDANMETAADLIREARAAGAHLVVLPLHAIQINASRGSTVVTDAESEAVRASAEPVPGPITQWLITQARQAGVFAMLGMTELGEDDELYMTSVLAGPGGLIATYRAGSLWDRGIDGNEDMVFARGSSVGTVVDTPLGRLGMMVNLDLWYAAGGSLLPDEPDLIVTVASWGDSYIAPYRDGVTAKAQENGAWHVCANQFGPMGPHIQSHYGHSMVVDPSGEIVAETEDGQSMVITEVGLMIDPAALGLTPTAVPPDSWASVKRR